MPASVRPTNSLPTCAASAARPSSATIHRSLEPRITKSSGYSYLGHRTSPQWWGQIWDKVMHHRKAHRHHSLFQLQYSVRGAGPHPFELRPLQVEIRFGSSGRTLEEARRKHCFRGILPAFPESPIFEPSEFHLLPCHQSSSGDHQILHGSWDLSLWAEHHRRTAPRYLLWLHKHTSLCPMRSSEMIRVSFPLFPQTPYLMHALKSGTLVGISTKLGSVLHGKY